MCHCRLSILNPAYKKLVKEGLLSWDEVSSFPDARILVPCGKCPACRRQKALLWRGRLLREFDDFCESRGFNSSAPISHAPVYFVTLTVNDRWRALVEDSPSRVMRWFFENLRAVSGRSPRHWFIVEYGDYKKYTGRIHFHGLLFGLNGLTFSDIREAWPPHSRVDISRVRSRACMTYVTKYITKSSDHALASVDTDRFPYLGKIYSSSGIGSRLFTESAHSLVEQARSLESFSVVYKGRKFAVPYYYARRAMDGFDTALAVERRVLNACYRQMIGWARFFGLLTQTLSRASSVLFSDGLRYLSKKYRYYAHVAVLEDNPDPIDLRSARESVKSLLNFFDNYEYDCIRPPGGLSAIQCALRTI